MPRGSLYVFIQVFLWYYKDLGDDKPDKEADPMYLFRQNIYANCRLTHTFRLNITCYTLNTNPTNLFRYFVLLITLFLHVWKEINVPKLIRSKIIGMLYVVSMFCSVNTHSLNNCTLHVHRSVCVFNPTIFVDTKSIGVILLPLKEV